MIKNCGNCSSYRTYMCAPDICMKITEMGDIRYQNWSDDFVVSPEFCVCGGETVVLYKRRRSGYYRQRYKCKKCGLRFWARIVRETPE